MSNEGVGAMVKDAIRWWEPRRAVYNLALLFLVTVYFIRGYPHTRAVLEVNSLLLLFGLAVMANVAYCAAYFVDLFAQLGGYREALVRVRFLLFAVGTAFALVLTHFWSKALLGV